MKNQTRDINRGKLRVQVTEQPSNKALKKEERVPSHDLENITLDYLQESTILKENENKEKEVPLVAWKDLPQGR